VDLRIPAVQHRDIAPLRPTSFMVVTRAYLVQQITRVQCLLSLLYSARPAKLENAGPTHRIVFVKPEKCKKKTAASRRGTRTHVFPVSHFVLAQFYKWPTPQVVSLQFRTSFGPRQLLGKRDFEITSLYRGILRLMIRGVSLVQGLCGVLVGAAFVGVEILNASSLFYSPG
jgi:hypothetical protein